MSRKIKFQPASQQSLDELKGIIVSFAADVDRRFTKTATVDMLSDVKATVDRHTAVLDHIVGELKGLQDSRVLLGAMFKDHGCRLTALEARQAPPAP